MGGGEKQRVPPLPEHTHPRNGGVGPKLSGPPTGADRQPRAPQHPHPSPAGGRDHHPHGPVPTWRSLPVLSCSGGRLTSSALDPGWGLPSGALPASSTSSRTVQAGSLPPAAQDGRGDGTSLPVPRCHNPPFALTRSAGPHRAGPGRAILSLMGPQANGRRWWPQEGQGANGACLGSRVPLGVPGGLAAIQNQPRKGAGLSVAAELGPERHQPTWLQGEAGRGGKTARRAGGMDTEGRAHRG